MTDRKSHRVKAIFSDLDGTIVHFPAWFEEHGSKIVSYDPDDKTKGVVEKLADPAVKLAVPLVVDAGQGANWAEAH